MQGIKDIRENWADLTTAYILGARHFQTKFSNGILNLFYLSRACLTIPSEVQTKYRRMVRLLANILETLNRDSVMD